MRLCRVLGHGAADDPTRIAAQVVTGIGFLGAGINLHALSQAGLGLRRLGSEEIPDTSKVTVKAQVVAATRNDTSLEQISWDG